MTVNRALFKQIKLPTGDLVDIKYWAPDKTQMCVAGFDENDNQVTAVTYAGAVDIADELHSALKTSLIGSLANVIEFDLTSNPSIHFRPAK